MNHSINEMEFNLLKSDENCLYFKNTVSRNPFNFLPDTVTDLKFLVHVVLGYYEFHHKQF